MNTEHSTATAVRPEATPDNRIVVGTFIENDILRHGIDAVLRLLPTVGRVHHCTLSEDVAAAMIDERYDVLITADREIAGAASEARGHTRILVLVDEADVEDVALEVPAADGFLLKHELTSEQLRSAIAQVSRGEMVVPSSLARRLLCRRAEADGPKTASPARITDRQLAALRLMADGLSNKQIARRLLISEHGVKRLVTSIMLKLDAPNRTTAVLSAIRCGVLPAPGHVEAG